MSFELNGPTPINKPMIQESQNMQNDGGAGNLGYFKRGKQKKKKDEDSFDSFESSSSEDTFEKSDLEVVEAPEINLKEIGKKIKNFFKKDNLEEK